MITVRDFQVAVGLLTLVLSLGCSGTAGPDENEAVDVNVDGGIQTSADGGRTDTASEAPAGPGLSYQEFASWYGVIETVAGTAEIEDKGVDGWTPEMEGGAAVDAELSRPHITLADDEGNLFIADKDADAVRKVDVDGVITTVAGPGEVRAPNGLWVARNVVYILDLGNDRVAKLEDGQLTTLFEIGGAGAGRGLWVSDDESVAFVSAGSTLKKWTREGGVSTLATGFVSLGNLHVGPHGRLGVTDRGGHLVYAVDPVSGEKTVIAGNGTITGGGDGELATETGLNEVRGIWFEANGGFLLCTHKGGDVWFVDDDGRIHLMIAGDANDSHAGDGERFDVPGDKISEPRAVSISPMGDIIITEHDGGYVRVVRREY